MDASRSTERSGRRSCQASEGKVAKRSTGERTAGRGTVQARQLATSEKSENVSKMKKTQSDDKVWWK